MAERVRCIGFGRDGYRLDLDACANKQAGREHCEIVAIAYLIIGGNNIDGPNQNLNHVPAEVYSDIGRGLFIGSEYDKPAHQLPHATDIPRLRAAGIPSKLHR